MKYLILMSLLIIGCTSYRNGSEVFNENARIWCKCQKSSIEISDFGHGYIKCFNGSIALCNSSYFHAECPKE